MKTPKQPLRHLVRDHFASPARPLCRVTFLPTPGSHLSWLSSFFAGVLLLPLFAVADRPNIVFFLIDDLGWTDVGFMGSQFYETPHIDRLSQSGMVFTNAYANGPNCAPSRASLMTGQYTPRHGIFTVGDPVRGNHRFRKLEPTPNTTVLAEEFLTFPEVLQASGYRTASLGKWHLGKDPRSQGFDVNVAGREWGSPSGGGYHSPFEYPNLSSKTPGDYLTDRLTDAACQFIEDSKGQPFFLYLTHYAVHTPIQAKEQQVQKYRSKQPGPHHSHPVYAAMVESVDDSVGRVLAKLEELNLTSKTVVVFFSDNGGHMGPTSNAPLRGAKGMLYEGGIREPMIVRWPGVTAAGTRCSEPVIGIDFFPTILEMAGVPRSNTSLPKGHPLDGCSLVPLLKDEQAKLSRKALFWHFPCYLQGSGGRDANRPFRTTPAGAIRMGRWKLIEYFEDGGLELFDLFTDIGERQNLALERPETVRRLHAAIRSWREELDAPVPIEPNPRYEGG